MRFGERLKNARQNKELTQENAGVIFKVSRKTISSWETENSYPDINTLIKISNFYHISLDTLLKEDVGMKEFLDKSDVKKELRPVKIGLNLLGCTIFFPYISLLYMDKLNLNILSKIAFTIFMIILIILFTFTKNRLDVLEKKFGIYQINWLDKLMNNKKPFFIAELILTIILITSILIFLLSNYDTTVLTEFVWIIIITLGVSFYKFNNKK
ncbi:helix-turn-helix domain-containing protein [Apilactobacillus micheneri]|uniref:helix-turn-helix domain-containing protein n=1 Tax=Apilactobacillus micheneri TaxID=1899430 RepID=UPI000D5141C4|nr:helix-turn-helix transcriptional regulator [Apilactobacillus micheneri]GAY80039.1 HTH-type transcriptional regulator ImmR [Apilactobacillus micheneri]